MTRRLLDRLLALGLLGSVLGAVTPVLGYLWPLKGSASAGREFIDAAGNAIEPASIVENAGVVGRLSGRPVLVFRRGGRLLGFDAVCPHLGCMVRWSAKHDAIECPCHGGRFNLEGAVISGPPPEGLNPVAVRVEGGRVVPA